MANLPEFIDPDTGKPLPAFVDPDSASAKAKERKSPTAPHLGVDPTKPDNRTFEQKNPQKAKEIEGKGRVELFLKGVGSGLQNMMENIGQFATTVGGRMAPGEDTRKFTRDIGERLTKESEQRRSEFEPYKQYGPFTGYAKGGEFLGETAPWLLAGPELGGESLLGRTAGGAAMGGLMGATEFVPPSTKNPLAQRGTNLLTGAGAGALGGLGGGLLTKTGKAAAGSVPATETRQLAEKEGVRDLTYAEEKTGQSSWSDQMREHLPSWLGGIKPLRERQAADAESAMASHFAQYTVDPASGSTEAMRVANDEHLDKMYEQVRKNAPLVPHGKAENTKIVVGQLRKDYPGVFEAIQNSRAKSILNNIGGELKDKKVETMTLDKSGNPITRMEPPDFSFDDLWALRKNLGKEIGSAKDNIAHGAYSQLYGAVSDDIDRMLEAAPGAAFADFKKANADYKQYGVKFDALRDAYDKAMGTTGSSGMFSPQAYAKELRNLANDPKYKKNVKWTEEEIGKMSGLANVLQVVNRSAQYMQNPRTGYSLIPFALAGLSEETAHVMGMSGTGSIEATAGSVGALGAAGLVSKFLTTTRFGKDLLMAAAKVEPDSQGMQWIMWHLYSKIPQYAASEAAMRGARKDTPMPSGEKQPPQPANPNQAQGQEAPIPGRQEGGPVEKQEPKYEPASNEGGPKPLERGNIDYNTRPAVKLPDGKVASVRSITITGEKGAYLIPTVADDGRIMSNREAVEQFNKTGKHLGRFKTEEDADRYAEMHHAEMGPQDKLKALEEKPKKAWGKKKEEPND